LQASWFICGLGTPLLTSLLLYLLAIFYFVWGANNSDPSRAQAFTSIAWGLFGWATFLWVGFGLFATKKCGDFDPNVEVGTVEMFFTK
jgi:hypothetical protein